MKSDAVPGPNPGDPVKYYGVRAGHVPGVYPTYAEALEQVTGFKGGKQKSFLTWEEAQEYVDEGRRMRSGDTPISLKGHLDSTYSSIDDPRKSAKKMKRNDGSAEVPIANGYVEPGTGPLPPNAEDGFDDTIILPPHRNDGKLEYKTEAERNARKKQPTGEFEGVLQIWTDGAAKGNGKVGAYAGIGIWFGPNDPR